MVVVLPEVALTGTGSDRVHMHNRKLHNIQPSGAFWPEVKSSNITRSDKGCAHAQPEEADTSHMT